MDYLFAGLIEAFRLLFARDPETFSAILVTLKVTTCSMAASFLMGVPLGFFLGFFEFFGRWFLRTVTNTLLAFPTVLIGLLVYAFLSQRGPLGGLGLLFTPAAIIIGQTILALPIVVALTAAAVEGLDKNLRLTLLSLGANRRQLAVSTLWEARYGILIAAATAYGRVLTEVGISLMVGGNIKWYTRTITTAIALETAKGRFSMGIALGLVLLMLAFGVNLILFYLRRRW